VIQFFDTFDSPTIDSCHLLLVWLLPFLWLVPGSKVNLEREKVGWVNPLAQTNMHAYVGVLCCGRRGN